LNMSQSGVSRAIARLEARLGVRLLERTTRTVTLSEEGGRLYEQILPLLEGLEEAAASVAASKDAVRGTLRVNMDPFISQLILGPQLSRFLKQFPALKLELITRDRLGDLVAEGFDLAVRFGEPRPSALVARKLLDTRVVTVASPAYLKKAGRPDHPSRLEEGNHRLIDFRDPETGKTLIFLTNQVTLPALTICALYKSRWQVELFFKWIKQHLRIKQFYGISENAVKTQIWIAVSVYVLVAIVRKRLRLEASLYTLLQVFSVTVFEKMPIQSAIFSAPSRVGDVKDNNQLELFTF